MEELQIQHTDTLQKIIPWLGTGSIDIFGVPFAGKDTQCEILATLLNGTRLSSGQILRGSVIPEHVQSYMKRGELIPTTDFLNIVLPYLQQPELQGRPLILSSVGRWHGEEEGVLKATATSQHPLKAVVFINLDTAEIWKRLEASHERNDRGVRADDNKATIQIRLDEFATKTKPVLEYYRDMGILIEVDGNKPVDQVTSEILTGLLALATS